MMVLGLQYLAESKTEAWIAHACGIAAMLSCHPCLTNFPAISPDFRHWRLTQHRHVTDNFEPSRSTVPLEIAIYV